MVIDPRNRIYYETVFLKMLLNMVQESVLSVNSIAVDVAGKTGTTNDAKDVWFDGYTPDLVAITWIGYDQKSRGRQFGATLALRRFG